MDHSSDDIVINIDGYDISDQYTYTDSTTLDLSSITIASPDPTVTISDGTGFNITWWEDQEIVNTEREERAIRERNEGVRQAWEQYKIMVELARNPPEPLA